MADLTTRDTKLIQYLNEAYGKEKELETALTAHIGMTTRAAYKKRLQEHLRETKAHARAVERRIKQLGGKADSGDVVTEVASRATAAAKGPLHTIRGTGEQEKMLKNAKTEYSEEHEEIATYTAIERRTSTRRRAGSRARSRSTTGARSRSTRSPRSTAARRRG